jgi:hypothetical protein
MLGDIDEGDLSDTARTAQDIREMEADAVSSLCWEPLACAKRARSLDLRICVRDSEVSCHGLNEMVNGGDATEYPWARGPSEEVKIAVVVTPTKSLP